MELAKVFTTGRSQAVRIPKKYRFDVSEVEISKNGNQIILRPVSKEEALKKFLAMPAFPDFSVKRDEAQKVQERELFK